MFTRAMTRKNETNVVTQNMQNNSIPVFCTIHAFVSSPINGVPESPLMKMK